MIADARFLFVVCQVGAEAALKREMSHAWPALRIAFSRPGFLTFKLPADVKLAEEFELGCMLGRAAGFCLGKVTAACNATAAAELWRLVGPLEFDHLHVWQRDSALPGDRGFEPGISLLAAEIAPIIAAARPIRTPADGSELAVNQEARVGQRILDCVLVEPNEWWFGWHRAAAPASRWPGGVPLIDPGKTKVVSRAYLKITEALAWSRLPLQPGDPCAEIGSAPGGSVQALLDRGLLVIGIDPAEMDESILRHPHFTHIRKRAADLKRREFRQVKWLFADSNVSPTRTLDSVESIVTHREVRVRGMLLTLKMTDWSLAEEMPAILERVQSWGYSTVAARQLAFNRREICLAASGRQFDRQSPARRRQLRTGKS